MADTRQFMEVFRLTLERLEVGIVLLLHDDAVIVVSHRLPVLAHQHQEFVLRLGVADRQAESRGIIATEAVQHCRVLAVGFPRLHPHRVQIQRVGLAVGLVQLIARIHQVLNWAVNV